MTDRLFHHHVIDGQLIYGSYDFAGVFYKLIRFETIDEWVTQNIPYDKLTKMYIAHAGVDRLVNCRRFQITSINKEFPKYYEPPCFTINGYAVGVTNIETGYNKIVLMNKNYLWDTFLVTTC